MNDLVNIKSTQPHDLLKIRWCVNNVCNYKCRYCTSHDGTHRSPKDLDLIVKNFNHLFDHYSSQLRKNKFELEISGGEPTLWAELGEFISQIKSRKGVDIQIISNGSRTLRWWQQYASLASKINFSLHPAHADLDKFIDVVDSVVEQGVDATVMVLMDPSIWDQCVHTIEYLKQYRKRSWAIEARPLFSIPGVPVSYSNEQSKYLQGSFKALPNFKILLKNLHKIKLSESKAEYESGKIVRADPTFYSTNQYTDFQGWSCHMPVENIYIHWDGYLQGSCGQQIYTNTYNILSENFDEDFKPFLGAVICSRKQCLCQPEQHISKFKLG